MTIRKILTFPDPRLFVVTHKVTAFDEALQSLVTDMWDTLYACPNGVGLAATQIGADQCVAIINVTGHPNDAYTLINPEILEKKEEHVFVEGCLSVPGVQDKITRARWVHFRAQDIQGQFYEKTVEGIFAECVQHEIDHLDGKLYYHLLSQVKQQRLLERYRKWSGRK